MDARRPTNGAEAANTGLEGHRRGNNAQEETVLERMKALRAAGMYPGIERAGQW